MKNFINKLLPILLVLTMLTVMCTTLVACNKEEDTSDNERTIAVDTLENTILSSINSDWNKCLTNEEIVSKETAGDYIVTSTWTGFICDAIKSSYIQTAKINTLNSLLTSEDGKKVLSNLEENSELIFTLLRKTGFTANDIAYLAYDLVYDLVDNSGLVIDGISSRMEEVRTLAQDKMKETSDDSQKTIYLNVVKNIDEIALSISVAKKNVPTQADEEIIKAAVVDAKDSIISITSFAYNMSINTISEDLFNIITSEEGALSDITETEVQTFVGALVNNITVLKNELTSDKLIKLNKALELVINNFDKQDVTSKIYVQIVEYGKAIYSLVDFVPTMCDAFAYVGNVLSNTEFLTQIKTVLEDDKASNFVKKVNASKIAATLINGVIKNYSKNDMLELIDSSIAKATDIQKSSALFTIDMLVNMGGYQYVSNSKFEHPTLMTTDDFADLLVLSGFNSAYATFKDTYYQYTIGKATVTELTNAATKCGFKNYLDVANPKDATTQTEAWYEYYLNQGYDAVNDRALELISIVKDDLKAFVEDYYANESNIKSALDTIEGWEIVNSLEESAYKANYETTIKYSGLFFIISMLTTN